MTAATGPPPAVPVPTDHDWISIHAFYASSIDPMLVECVGPLTRRLRGSGLIDGYFFIRYWLEGPHLRLRLLPANGVPPAVVRAEAEAELNAFLTRRPAPPPEADPGTMAEHDRRLFVAEYGQQKWDETYGPTGRIPTRPNNTCHYVPYEREYRRYGGPAGVELAEWHFEASSDMVLRLLASMRATARSRTLLLGCSLYLTLGMCYVFLGDDERIARFLTGYRDAWERAYVPDPGARHADYDTRSRPMAGRLGRRVRQIRSTAADPRRASTDAAASEWGWLAHCWELRDRLRTLTAAGRIEPAGGDVTERLLSSYVHMTNNRLGVSVLEEAYLAHVLAAAVRNESRHGAGAR